MPRCRVRVLTSSASTTSRPVTISQEVNERAFAAALRQLLEDRIDVRIAADALGFDPDLPAAGMGIALDSRGTIPSDHYPYRRFDELVNARAMAFRWHADLHLAPVASQLGQQRQQAGSFGLRHGGAHAPRGCRQHGIGERNPAVSGAGAEPRSGGVLRGRAGFSVGRPRSRRPGDDVTSMGGTGGPVRPVRLGARHRLRRDPADVARQVRRHKRGGARPERSSQHASIPHAVHQGCFLACDSTIPRSG